MQTINLLPFFFIKNTILLKSILQAPVRVDGDQGMLPSITTCLAFPYHPYSILATRAAQPTSVISVASNLLQSYNWTWNITQYSFTACKHGTHLRGT